MTLLEVRPGAAGDPFEGLDPEGIDPFIQLSFVHGALDDCEVSDLTQLDDDWFAHLVGSAERTRTRVDSMLAGIAAEAQRRGHDRRNGFGSATAYIKHHAASSGLEARARMQLTRLFELLPVWKDAAAHGEVGSDQLRLMARVGANPRLADALVVWSSELLFDAQQLSYDEFERRLRDFARSADSDGSRAEAEKAHEARDLTLRQLPNGSWRLSARFGSLQGAEINEILAHFNDAEFRTDWDAAQRLLGTDAGFDDLARSESQRRADALQRALEAAASAPGGGAGPLATLNVLIDDTTLERVLLGQPLDPANYRNIVCRTQNGDQIDVTEAAAVALYGHVRRVLHDGAGVVTELGRRSRLFRGNNRDAALLLVDRCMWPGCDTRVRTCQADHAIEWLQDGDTDPDNATCLCGRHNRLKHTGHYTARRDHDGRWNFYDPDNHPVG